MVKLGWHDLFHRVNHLVVPVERRTDSKKNFQAVSNLIAVIAIQFIRPMIDRELRAESDVYAIAMRKIVHVTKWRSVDRKYFCEVRALEDEFVSRFFHALEPGIKSVALMLKIRLEQERLRFAFVGVVVLSPDKGRGPIRVVAQRLIIYDRSGGAVAVHRGLESLRAFQVAMRKLQSKIWRRVPGNASAGGIEARPIKIVAVFVRLASGENAALDFHGAPDQPAGGNTKCDVRRVLPVMAKRRIGIVHCRNAMHECGRPQGWLAGIAEINVARKIGREFLRVGHR